MPIHAAATIAGRVVDETSAGVAEARVTIRSVGAGEIRSAICDPTGAFSVVLAGPGRYVASVERDGFFPLKDFPLDVTEATREIHLAVNHVREVLESMKVTVPAGTVDIDKTAAERKLTGLEIIDVPFTSNRDLRAALPLLPGVVKDANGDLHFDGGAENQTLYLLDGFNISDPLTGKLDARVSVESVRSVDWSSGRYSAEFGKGSGGALAIRTDMGDDRWRYSATNFLPGFDTRAGLHLGTWAPRFNVSGPLKPGRAWFSEHVDASYSQPVVPGLPRNQDRTQIFQASNLVRAQVNLTPSNILFADFLMNYKFAPQTGLDALDPISTTTDQRSRTWFFSFRDQIYLTRGMLLEVGYAEDRNYFRVIPQGEGFYNISPFGKTGNYYIDSTRKARRGQFLTNLFLPSFELWGHHQWKTGIDLDRLNYWQNVRRTGINVYDTQSALVRQTVFAGNGVLSRPSFEASWYVLDDWKVRADVMIEAGVRQDWDEVLRRAAFSPRVAVSWAPLGSKNTKISAGYAVVRDATQLDLLTRPEDQYAIDSYFNALPGPLGPLGTLGTLVNRFAIPNSHLAFPMYQNWSVGWEQRLPRRIALQVTGLRKQGDKGLAYAPVGTAGLFDLGNSRHDSYNAAEISVRQGLGNEHEWMFSYTRSRARSTAVIDLNVDQPLGVLDNAGPLNWDTPNRFVSWAYLPTRWTNWAVAYSMEARSGFPYSQVNDGGEIVGGVNAQRFPWFFSLNLHPEWKFTAFNRRWALRGGFNNITGHRNPTVVETVPGQPVVFLGSEGRHFVFRVRWLGKPQN